MDETADVTELKQTILEKFGYEVAVGETGELGVFIVDQPKGEYKFKRGLRHSVMQKHFEHFEDAAV